MTGDGSYGALLTRLDGLLRRGVSVAVEGQFGSGKSETLRAAALAVEPDLTIIRLRGTARGSQSAYVALGDLVKVSAGSVPHPAMMFAQLSTRLRELATERPVLLVIDNFDYLDPASRALCTMVLGTPSVSVLVSCNRVADSPELRAAVSSAAMLTVTLSALSAEEGKLVIERVLGGPVSMSVASSFHAHAKGNPRILSMLTAHARENGTIALLDGLWRTTAHYAEPFTSGSLRSGLTVLQSRLNDQERAALEVLAVAGSVHIEALAQHCDVLALERLQREGMVEARDGGNTYWLHSKALAHILRQTLDDARGRQIWSTVVLPEISLRGAQPPGANLVWALQRGIEVDDGALLAAADEAMRAYSPRISAQLLSAVTRPTAESVRMRAEAHWYLDEVAEARRLLASSVDSTQVFAIPGAPAAEEADVAGLVGAVFTAAESALGERAEPSILGLLVHRRNGNYPALLELGGSMTFREGSEAHYLATMLAAEAHAACGDPSRAALMTIDCALTGRRMRSAVVRDIGETVHYRVLFLNGQWRALKDLLDEKVVRNPGRLLFGDRSTLMLTPLIARGPHDRMVDRDHRALADADLFSWFVAQCADLLTGPGAGAEAIAGLHRLAGDERLTGLPGLQLFALGAAVQRQSEAESQLDEEATELDLKRLERCARSVSGPLARQFGLLAQGLLSRDPSLLVRSAQTAARNGNEQLSTVAAGLASRAAGKVKQPEVQRAAQVLIPDPVRRADPVADEVLLTRRERQVTDLALADSKNSEIAAVLGISPRTAERHLQNAYRKLGVSTRDQLRQAFGPQADESIDTGGV